MQDIFSRLTYLFFNQFADFVFTVAGIIILLAISWVLLGPTTCRSCGNKVSRRHTLCPYCATRLKK
ncbi:MAG: hypothetical protein FJZ11_01030 [Candidatus Omnitrophica bacterium]|nr:hypothetical protein [Candidatus Omnitrophota bacterium]